ncbi:MAG: peptidase M14 [Ignavibacteriales bacterium]|nr:peptidase M14 [Ignavibacteriales bacterium]
MKTQIVLFFVLLSGFGMAQPNAFVDSVAEAYDRYREPTLEHRRFKHADILPLIDALGEDDRVTVHPAGKSVEGRSLSIAEIGEGPTTIFMWTQMHGDEPTATRATFDFFNFLLAEDEFDEFRRKLLAETTIYAMIMVNPDGAERFTRRNAMDIDLNRDAATLATPEARSLMSAFLEIQPDYAFNLHDQKSRYAAGEKDPATQATISFLAPAFNEAKEWNENRKRATRLISIMIEALETRIPDGIGKYNDDYESRAFGDAFQAKGAATILIESGAHPGDPEREIARRMNFVAYLAAFDAIIDGRVDDYPTDRYDRLPMNDDDLFHLLITGGTARVAKGEFRADVGVNREERNYNNATESYVVSEALAVGDLSDERALEVFDATGMTIEPGAVSEKTISSLEELETLDVDSLLRAGVTAVRLEGENVKEGPSPKPITVTLLERRREPFETAVKRRADLTIRENGDVRAVVVNGFVIDFKTGEGAVRNGLIIR